MGGFTSSFAAPQTLNALFDPEEERRREAEELFGDSSDEEDHPEPATQVVPPQSRGFNYDNTYHFTLQEFIEAIPDDWTENSVKAFRRRADLHDYVVEFRVEFLSGYIMTDDELFAEDYAIITKQFFAKNYENPTKEDWAKVALNAYRSIEYQKQVKSIVIKTKRVNRRNFNYLNLRMFGSDLTYRLFSGKTIVKNENAKEGECLKEYAMQLERMSKALKYQLSKKNKLRDVIKFCEDNDVGLVVLDPLMQVIAKVQSKNRNFSQVKFIINGSHCFGLSDCLSQKLKHLKKHDVANLLSKDMNQIAGKSSQVMDDLEVMDGSFSDLSDVNYIQCDNNNFRHVLEHFVIKNKNLGVSFKLSSSNISAFGLDGKIFIQAEDYFERQRVYEFLSSKLGGRFNIPYANQSWLKIAEMIQLEYGIRFYPASYNKHTKQIIDDYFPKPWNVSNTPFNCYGVDIKKCHLNAMKRISSVPIPCIFDYWRKWNTGEEEDLPVGWYLTKDWHFKGLLVPGQIYLDTQIEYFLDNGMDESKIVSVLECSTVIDDFPLLSQVQMFEKCLEISSSAKLLANQYSGGLGRRYKNSDQLALIEGEKTLLCFALRDAADGYQIKFDQFLDNMFVYRRRKQTRFAVDNFPIYMAIISTTYQQNMELMHSIDEQPVCVKTDCVGYKNEVDEFDLTKYKAEGLLYAPCTGHFPTVEIDFDECSLDCFNVITGQGGTGKTYQLVKKFKELKKKKKCLILSQFNMPLQNVVKDYPNMKSSYTSTFEMFWEKHKDIKYQYLFIDEYSCVSWANMQKLYAYCVENNCTAYLYGDDTQLPPVKDRNQKYISFKLFADRVITKLEQLKRGDAVMKKFLDYLLKHHKINWKLYAKHYKRKSKPARVICFTNTCRKKHNDKMKKSNPNDFVVIEDTNHKLGVVNGQQMRMHQLMKLGHPLIEYQVKMDKKQHRDKVVWSYAYAITCHKAQGKTITKHYLIDELEKMSLEMAYVAFSRAKSLDKIHIVDYQKHKLANKKFKPIKSAKTTSLTVDYINMKSGTIYLWYDNKQNYYIGETFDYDKRIAQHKKIHKITHHQKLAEVLVADKAELLAIETQFINYYHVDGQKTRLNKKQVYDETELYKKQAQIMVAEFKQNLHEDFMKKLCWCGCKTEGECDEAKSIVIF